MSLMITRPSEANDASFSDFFIFSLSSSILPLSPYFLHFVFLFCFSFFSFVIPLFRFILFWSQTDRSTNRWPRLLIEMVLDAKLHFYHTRHVPNHLESLKFHFLPNLTKALPTNQPTNRPTDRRTRPLIEMRTHLKRRKFNGNSLTITFLFMHHPVVSWIGISGGPFWFYLDSI